MRSAVLLLLATVLVSCSGPATDPVSVSGTVSSGKVFLDLSDPKVLTQAPVAPGLWAWDANVLWQPVGEGRPETLLPAVALPGPETGGTLVRDLIRPYRPNEHGGLTSATASVEVSVPPDSAVLLRIGSFPGAQRVWVNGVVVLDRGVLSLDPRLYRAGSSGDEIQVQPIAGRLTIVANLVTNNPLVAHRELNRLWSLASVSTGFTQAHERIWRAFQIAVLGLVCLVFLLIGTQFRRESGLVEFGLFLLVCLLKLVFNVEESRTLLALLGLEADQTVILFLNHGLNLVPFVLFLWFLRQRFPAHISRTMVLVAAALCLLLELWELVPFLLLAAGWAEIYHGIMSNGWSLVLNIAVVLTVLITFERLFQIDRAKLPLGRMLFGGGILLGLIIMVPVILSVFGLVPFALFLGAGLFVFLILVSWELIRLELLGAQQLRQRLLARSAELESLVHFFPQAWAPRLGRARVEDVRPGDQRLTEAVVVQMTSDAPWSSWLPVAQALATKRQAVFVGAQSNSATWILDSRPENALAFGLEVQSALPGNPTHSWVIAATKSVVELSVLDASELWIPRFEPLPLAKLGELTTVGLACGAHVVLDVVLKDGLVVGGWRRHRQLTPDAQVIELFEGEAGPELAGKLATVVLFEQSLHQAAQGDHVGAVAGLLEILRVNPLDQASRYYLDLWQALVPRPR